MSSKYRLALIDEEDCVHPVMDPDDSLDDYDLTNPMARASLCEDIISAIDDADRARGIK